MKTLQERIAHAALQVTMRRGEDIAEIGERIEFYNKRWVRHWTGEPAHPDDRLFKEEEE